MSPEPMLPGERLAPPSPEPGRRRPKPAKPSRTAGGAKPAKRRSGLRFFARLVGLLFALGVAGAAVGGLFAYNAYQRYAAELPTLDGLRHYQPRVMSRIYAGDSRLVAELATERRIFVPVSAIPAVVKQAFISAEDQKFWSHHGIDPLAIARAAWYDVQQYGQGRRPVGASTITQQVAKNMLLGNELSLARKAKEMILAFKIEDTLTKERILELYLNEIYLGLQAYGVAAAAQTYFNKGLDELTLSEAAFLAALPKAPNNYNPFRFPDAAKARRDWVLDRMLEDRAISPKQATEAKASPIRPSPFRRPEVVAGGEWFGEEVRRQLVEHFGADQTTQGGLVVRTSLDPQMQAAADAALRFGLMQYDRTHGGWHGVVARMDAGSPLRTTWAERLAKTPRAPGGLPEWRMAVVLDITNDTATLGWFDPSNVPPGARGVPRTTPALLSDSTWARVIRNGVLGPAPRRMSDLVAPGDVVFAELLAGSQQGRGAGRADRMLLRQMPQVQGALIAIEPKTGRVLAMSGGWSYDSSQFNRATQAERQPGSSFKPFVYLAALESGLSPSQRILDAPFVQNAGKPNEWKPLNYSGSFSGQVPMRIALEKSLNLVTVRLAERVGIDAVDRVATAFHVVDGMPHVLAASLGAVETTVLRQASAYAGLAMGGKEVLPTLVDSVQDRDGSVLWRPASLICQGCNDPANPPTLLDNRAQVADEQSVFQVLTMMQGVVARGTGFAAGNGLNRPIAGKTGTTQDANDAWFVGTTPDLTVAVWMGYDNNTSLGERETGGGVAAPIFHNFMLAVMRGRPVLQFPMPPGLTLASWGSGSGSVTDAFKPGQTPGATDGVIGGNEGGGGGGGGGGGEGLVVGAGGPGTGVDTGMGGLY